MKRCRPLLGTFVEVTVPEENSEAAINCAFSEIEKVQNLKTIRPEKS